MLCSAAVFAALVVQLRGGFPVRAAVVSVCISVGFGLLAWRMRATTAVGATIGAGICLALSLPQTPDRLVSPLLSGLVALFVLTQAGTRFRRERKERMGLAEDRRGRKPAQILANLAVAAIFASLGRPMGAVAALGEATADTLASECGQALGGRTLLVTTWRAVTPGTDGGLSVWGTIVGCLGATLVVLSVSRSEAGLVRCTAAAWVGFLFDSLLGATLEQQGVLDNDMVNLCSTAAAAVFAEFVLRGQVHLF